MCLLVVFFFFKQKTAYEMRISDWSSDVCSSDLVARALSGSFARRVAAEPACSRRHPERPPCPARVFRTAWPRIRQASSRSARPRWSVSDDTVVYLYSRLARLLFGGGEQRERRQALAVCPAKHPAKTGLGEQPPQIEARLRSRHERPAAGF